MIATSTRAASPSFSLETLEGDIRALAEQASRGPAMLAQNHPAWLDILADTGERPLGAAAMRDGEIAGWIIASAREADRGIAVSALPYVGYGNAAVPTGEPEVAAALYRWLGEAARDLGAGAVTVGMPPVAPEGDVTLAEESLASGGRGFRFLNFSQVQPLRPHPLEQVSKRRREALGRFIRRAEREEVEVGPCDDPAQFEAWLAIYKARYGDIGARPIPDAFHRSLFERGRAAGFAEFWTATRHGRLLGGTIFLLGTDLVDYCSSAYEMDEEARTLTPNNLVLSRAFESLAERGRSWFNWQSSPGREGVYRYKAGWGAEERPQVYVGCLLDGPAGERLSAATPDEVLAGFPSRFVLPFSMLTSC